MNDTRDALEQQAKEGHGTVPNAPAAEKKDEVGKLKEALHDLEEKKGDWGKDR